MKILSIVAVALLAASTGPAGEPGVELGRAGVARDPARPLQVLVRGFDSSSTVEIDVFRGDEVVVSFVTSFGSGGRGVCEAVFVDEDAWFGWCSVYDFPFDNVTELATSRARSHLGDSRKTYFVSARTESCSPDLLSDQARFADIDAIGRDMILPAMAEMSTWPADAIADLKESLAVVGDHGCPILGRALLKLFGIDRSLTLRDDDFAHLDDIPDDLAVALGHEQRLGLGDWLDEVVRGLP